MVRKDRVPHALLFSGQEGVGKKLTAMAFARQLLCQAGTSCGVCSGCRKAEKGVHPDLWVLTGEDSIGVDEVRGNTEKGVRGINREVYEHPIEAKRRVIVIDGAERMTREATNALLKTLEEPPAFNVFVLISASERAIPRTIRSRCARVAFGPLPEPVLRDFFGRELKGDGDRAEMLSAIALGSIATGLFWAKEENFLLRKRLAAVITGKERSYIEATLVAERISANVTALSTYLHFVLSLLRDMYVVSLLGDLSMTVNRDMRGMFDPAAHGRTWIVGAMRSVEQTLADLRYNVNRWALVEDLLLQIMRLR